MNRILITLLFCFFSFAQNIYDIQVHNSSKLVIKGESNVTDFSCLFEHDISDHKHIVTSEIAEGLILLENANIKVPINRFDCGIFLMNQDFRKALGGEKYPFINIKIDRFRINYNDKKDITSISSFLYGIVISCKSPNNPLYSQTIISTSILILFKIQKSFPSISKLNNDNFLSKLFSFST